MIFRCIQVEGRCAYLADTARVTGRVTLGDGVSVWPSAVIRGDVAPVIIGRRCLIAAGALVPPGLLVPDDHVVMGVPGRVLRPTSDKEQEYLAWLADHYVQLAERYYEKPDDPAARPYGE